MVGLFVGASANAMLDVAKIPKASRTRMESGRFYESPALGARKLLTEGDDLRDIKADFARLDALRFEGFFVKAMDRELTFFNIGRDDQVPVVGARATSDDARSGRQNVDIDDVAGVGFGRIPRDIESRRNRSNPNVADVTRSGDGDVEAVERAAG
jgi:hypothetical protein